MRLLNILHSRLRSLLFGDRRENDLREERQFHLESVLRDVRYACRSFRRAPAVALTIVTTVALGLGLVAVVFTILNAAVLTIRIRAENKALAGAAASL